MTRKTKLSFAFVVPIALGAITLSVVTAASKNILSAKADPTSYELTLDSSKAPAGLTSSFQRRVESTVTTPRGSTLSFVYTTAKALDGGLVQLGNYGTVYCITDDNQHISGLTSVKVTYSGGSLTLKSSSVDTSDGSSYVTDVNAVTSGTAVNLANGANSFVLEAAEAFVSISEIKLTYSCSAVSTSYNFQKVYDVEDFESYTGDGIGHDSSHNMSAVTNLRSQFYSTYYGSGSNPMNGSGWSKMGSSDYLLFHAQAGRNYSKAGLFKAKSDNFFEYVQAKHYFGVPTAIGKGATLSAWIHGSYADTNGTAGSNVTVTLIAYYNKILNTSGLNDGASATFTINGADDWRECKVTLDPTKTVYGFGIHFAKTSSTAWVPIDDVKIYTESPYPAVPVTGVSVSPTLKLLAGQTQQLTATVLPVSADNQEVTWSSNNNNVATVSSTGLVTAIADGNATITVTTVDGGFTDQCAVTVGEDYPSGNFYARIPLSVMGTNFTVPGIIAIGGINGELSVWLNNSDAIASNLQYNKTTGQLSIDTSGDYQGIAYGQITATYDKNTNSLKNVKFKGDAGNYVTGNGNLTMSLPSMNLNCDGTNATLQATFRRFYKDSGTTWKNDDFNTNRFTADTENRIGGLSGMKMRPYSSAACAFALKNNIADTTRGNIGFWVYNPSSTKVKLNFYACKSANFDSFVGTGSFGSDMYCFDYDRGFEQGWHFFCIGFEKPGTFEVGTNTLYNFLILIQTTSTTLTFDNLCLYE